MLNLNKLNKMLDSVLDSETPESLNSWIDEQMAADQAQVSFVMQSLGCYRNNVVRLSPGYVAIN